METAAARPVDASTAVRGGCRPRLLFVGAFPPPGREVFGGMVTSCRLLLASSFSARLQLTLVDSTQVTNPPPAFAIRLLLAGRRLAGYVWKFERTAPEAVLLFSAPGASLAEKGLMAWYARLRGVPALMFPRGGAVIDACQASRFTRAWVRLAFGGARKVLCQGPAWRAFACDVLGFKADDAPIIFNWTASPELLSIGASRRGKGEGSIKLLFVGWLDREKGVRELLEAYCAVRSTNLIELTLVGEGNMSEAARAYVAANGLADSVTFRGWLQDHELRAEYAKADVFVLPSWVEGLPNAMIEAMAARLAIVVSAVGNIPDVVMDERDGLLVPPRDVAALAAALARVATDPTLRSRVAESAYERARGMFGIEAAAQALVGQIRNAAGYAAEGAVAGYEEH